MLETKTATNGPFAKATSVGLPLLPWLISVSLCCRATFDLSMANFHVLMLALALGSPLPARTDGQPIVESETVAVQSGALRLRGLLWRPNGHGAFPGVLFNHGSGLTNYPQEPATLGPAFARYGYVFLYLYRRGAGLSADQGINSEDLMARAFAEKGQEGRHALQPKTIPAASCELAAVQAAVNQAVDGDTVTIPECTARWTTELKVTKGITLQGRTTVANAGTKDATADDKTIIIDEVATAPSIVQLNSDKPYRITGLTFRGGTVTPKGSAHGALILGNATGRLNSAMRADHLHFDNLKRRAVWQDGWLYGVIDNVVIHASSHQPSFYFTQPRWNGENFGMGSWADFPYFGSEKFVFVEDCSILVDAAHKGGFLDNMNGARWVVRHSYWRNCAMSGHGTESGPQRGNRCDQWYDNVFEFTTASIGVGQSRSGNQIVHDNVWIDNKPSNNSVGGLKVYRMDMRGKLWGMAQGTNGWDNNDPKLSDSGVVAAVAKPIPPIPPSQRALTVTGKNWTKDQWARYSVTNISSTQPYHGILIAGNTADTLYIFTNYASDVPQADWVVFNPGDRYEIHKVVQALDQAGTGKGDLVKIVNGIPINQVSGKEHSWPHAKPEPCYSWNNTVQKTGQVLGFTGMGSITENRDFFNLGAGLPKDTIPTQVKNFYTAANNGNVAYDSEYTYPHPLRSGGDVPTATPVPTGTPITSPSPTATRTPTPSPTRA